MIRILTTLTVLATLALPAVAQPMPLPKTGSSPSGYTKSGGYCAPMRRDAPVVAAEHPRASAGSAGGAGGEFVARSVDRPKAYGPLASASFSNAIARDYDSASQALKTIRVGGGGTYPKRQIDLLVFGNVGGANAFLYRSRGGMSNDTLSFHNFATGGYPSSLGFIESNMSRLSDDERRHAVFYELGHMIDASKNDRHERYSNSAEFMAAHTRDSMQASARYAKSDSNAQQTIESFASAHLPRRRHNA